MKKCYFGLLLLLSFMGYGQEMESSNLISSSDKSTFQLYPNPATNGIVNITTATNGQKEIAIYDVFGEVVLRDRISNKTLNISRLVAGVYVLQLTEGNDTMTRKLVIK